MQGCAVAAVRYSGGAQGGMRSQIDTARGTVQARALVIATGGLSIPKIGAPDFGYRIANQFGICPGPPPPAPGPRPFTPRVWGGRGAVLVKVPAPPPGVRSFAVPLSLGPTSKTFCPN